MLRFVIGFVAMGAVAAFAAAPQTLEEGSWVCRTPEVYDETVEAARHRNGKALEELKQDLLDQKLCIYMDDDNLEDLMAPYVTVVTRQEQKVKVSFTVEFYKRIQYLHRRITRVTFSGWTDAENLKSRY